MPKRATDAAGMTPLGVVIKAAMDRHGWSTHRVHREGGPSASTTGRLISADPGVDRRPPNDANLRKLSAALRIPLGRLEAAAAETRGWVIAQSGHSEAIRDVVAVMEGVDANTQRKMAEVILIMHDIVALATWDVGLPDQARELFGREAPPQAPAPLEAAARTGTPLRVQKDAAAPDENVDRLPDDDEDPA